MRFRQGAEQAFAPTYEVDAGAMPGATAYSSYPGGEDLGSSAYSEAPFGQGKTTLISSVTSDFTHSSNIVYIVGLFLYRNTFIAMQRFIANLCSLFGAS